jgi:nicotinate phosphoribosyltransferase
VLFLLWQKKMLQCPSENEIATGLVTDHCCTLSREVLQRLGIADRIVTLEAHVRCFPTEITKGVYYGLGDVLSALQHHDVELWSMRPGSVFFEREPVLVLEGKAADLATIRPAITGVLTYGSSLVTRANEIVSAAGGRDVHFFGSRKLHPAHVRQYLECAYVAGMKINAAPQAREILPSLRLEDCQEHFSNLVADGHQDSWREFVSLPPDQGAVFIVLDNYNDPVVEAREAIEVLGDRIRGILLDTDSSRRGDIKSIIAEVSWHLRLMNRSDVKICLTGGVTPQLIDETKEDISSYGVGLSALDCSLFDFALQVVAVEGKARAKLGVQPGKKTVFVCHQCARRVVDLFDKTLNCCGSPMVSQLRQPALDNVRDLAAIRDEIRRNAG